jgi:hypothetical protein
MSKGSGRLQWKALSVIAIHPGGYSIVPEGIAQAVPVEKVLIVWQQHSIYDVDLPVCIVNGPENCGSIYYDCAIVGIYIQRAAI